MDNFTRSYLAGINNRFCITDKDTFDSTGIRYTQTDYCCVCNLNDLIEKVFLANNIGVIISLNEISHNMKSHYFIMKINALAVRYSSIETINFLIEKYGSYIDRSFLANALRLAAERDDDNVEIVKLIYDGSIQNNILQDAILGSVKCNNYNIFKFLFKQFPIFHISYDLLKLLWTSVEIVDFLIEQKQFIFIHIKMYFQYVPSSKKCDMIEMIDDRIDSGYLVLTKEDQEYWAPLQKIDY
jgi:hypothetical protein